MLWMLVHVATSGIVFCCGAMVIKSDMGPRCTTRVCLTKHMQSCCKLQSHCLQTLSDNFVGLHFICRFGLFGSQRPWFIKPPGAWTPCSYATVCCSVSGNCMWCCVWHSRCEPCRTVSDRLRRLTKIHRWDTRACRARARHLLLQCVRRTSDTGRRLAWRLRSHRAEALSHRSR